MENSAIVILRLWILAADEQARHLCTQPSPCAGREATPAATIHSLISKLRAESPTPAARPGPMKPPWVGGMHRLQG